jgi:hypothetical protein
MDGVRFFCDDDSSGCIDMIKEVRSSADANERRVFVMLELRQNRRLIVGPIEE